MGRAARRLQGANALEISRLLESLQICLAILFADHEMEQRPVVPQDITPHWLQVRTSPSSHCT